MLVLLSAGCEGRRADPPATLHNEPRIVVPLAAAGDRWLAHVDINGRDAGWFLLDTGSNTTAAERGVANRLGLPVVSHGVAHGIAGQEAIDFRGYQSLSVAGFALRPRALASLNMPAVRAAGILGFDALAAQAFTLDGAAGTLTLGDDLDESLRIERLLNFDGLPVVEAKLGGHAVWLLLDSGADGELSLHRDVVERRPNVLSVPLSGAGRSAGVGGSVEGALTWVSRLELLGVTLRDVAVSIDPRPPGLSDPRIAGRVGNQLLRHYRLTFDARNGRIAATWLPITAPAGR